MDHHLGILISESELKEVSCNFQFSSFDYLQNTIGTILPQATGQYTMSAIPIVESKEYNMHTMLHSDRPKSFDEVVKICFLTMTSQEKQKLKSIPEEDLIMCHSGWAVNMRNEFGMLYYGLG